MRMLAVLEAAKKISWRETRKKDETRNNRILTKTTLVVLSACLAGGFFYSLHYLFVEKNSLSALSQRLERNSFQKEDPSSFWTKFRLSPYVSAKGEEPKAGNEDLPNSLCRNSFVSLSNPDLEEFQMGNLCLNKGETNEEVRAEVMDILGSDPAEQSLKEKITPILKDTPMKTMIDSISKQDRTVAAFLVGIALKESGLGKHAPRKGGKDCYNYWGYKGNINPVAGGYSCFSSPQQAVEIVGKRLQTLVNKKIDTPSEMVVWKCGSSCNGHSAQSVQKWVQDVSKYFFPIKQS